MAYNQSFLYWVNQQTLLTHKLHQVHLCNRLMIIDLNGELNTAGNKILVLMEKNIMKHLVKMIQQMQLVVLLLELMIKLVVVKLAVVKLVVLPLLQVKAKVKQEMKKLKQIS